MEQVGEYTVNFDLKGRLGKGGQGEVFKGTDKSGRVIAAKLVDCKNYSEDEKNFVEREVKILQALDHHPHILKLRHHDFTEDKAAKKRILWIITDMCQGGNLSDYCEDKRVSNRDKLHFCVDIANGLAFVHARKVIHRDIKPENVLIKKDRGRDVIKIADFGLARDKNLRTLVTQCGTSPYMAPELFGEGTKYDNKVDVFALGVLILHLFTAKPGQGLLSAEVLGPNIGQALYFKQSANPILWPEDWYDDDVTNIVTQLKDLLTAMLRLTPHERPTMEEVHQRLEDIAEQELQGPPLDAPVTRDVSDADNDGAGLASAATASASHAVDELADQAAALPLPSHGVSVSTASIQRVASLQVPQPSGVNTAYGYHSDVLMGFEDCKDYHYYKLVGSSFKLKWTKPIPNGLDDNTCICMSENGYIYIPQKQTQSPTAIYNNHLQLIKHTATDADGSICAVINNENIIYNSWFDDDVHEKGKELVVRRLQDGGVVRRLVPQHGKYAADRVLYVGGHPHDGRVAVTMDEGNVLDVYNKHGKHTVHQTVSYPTGMLGCDDRHVFVPRWGEPPELYVYDWEGQQVAMFSHHELGLKSDDLTYFVSPPDIGTVILYVIQDEGIVFHAYKVSL